MTPHERPAGLPPAVRDLGIMAGLLLVYGLLQMTFGDVIAAGDGFGYDGMFYGELARDLRLEDLVHQIDAYRLQRVLPSAVVGLALALSPGAETNVTVVRAFQILSIVELIAALGLWWAIANRLALRRGTLWLGLVLLFLNFANLKQSYYYPVSTDTAAFFIGMAMYYFYIVNRSLALLAVVVLGSFAWPICGFVGALMLFAPFQTMPLATPSPSRRGLWLAVGAATVLTAAGLTIRLVLRKKVVGFGPVHEVEDLALPASASLHFAWLTCMLAPLCASATSAGVRQLQSAIRLRQLALAALALVLPRIVVALVAGPTKPLMSGPLFAAMLTLLPLSRPGITPVSHFAYFGLALLLLAITWKHCCKIASEDGLGSVLIVALSAVVALTPESRQSLLAFPMLVVILCRVLDRQVMSRWALLAAASLQLALSRFWLPLNDGFSPELRGVDSLPRYFMSQGPYMQNWAYLAFLVVLMVVGFSVLAFTRAQARAVRLP